MSQAMLPNLGLEQEVKALGKVWKVGRLEIHVLEKFYSWVQAQLPDPFEGLDKLVGSLPIDHARQLISEAQAKRQRALDWNSPEVEAYLNTIRGKIHMFWYLLQVHQPDATIDDAFKVVEAIGHAAMAKTVDLASGSPPASKNAEAPAA